MKIIIKKTAKKGRMFIGTCFALTVAASIGSVTATQAGQVKLTSLDGKVQMVGEIVGVDGMGYVLATASGTYTIKSYLVTCSGYACPSNSTRLAKTTKLTNFKHTSGDPMSAYTYTAAD